MRCTVLLLLCAMLGACAGTTCLPVCPVAPDGATTGTTAGIAWALFPPESGPGFFGDDHRYWHIDAGLVREALGSIRAHLHAETLRTLPEEEGDTEIWHEMVCGVIAKLPLYNCQALGVVKDGRRLVFLNFAHSRTFEPGPDYEGDDTDWTKEPYRVDDGGDWYWQILYDPATRRYLELYIHGEA